MSNPDTSNTRLSTSATREILAALVSFPTVSRTSNLALIDYVDGRLRDAGARIHRVASEDGTRANLFATLGPDAPGGVVLSGHSDVVPVAGQDWSVSPFELESRDGRHYGRGTADMKGFVAAAIACMEQAAERTLATPLHLALSFDEEIGCVGVRSLLDFLREVGAAPRFCIVGEPTNMGIATGHKGKIAMRAHFTGRAAHSALSPTGLNAVQMAAEFVRDVGDLQEELARNGARDGEYDVPYSTAHVGIIQGGTALNIVPDSATVDFEVRNIAADDPEALVESLKRNAEARTTGLRQQFPEAAVHLERMSAYPGLATMPDADVVSLMKQLTGANRTFKVAFGTEGGLFAQSLNAGVVVCGPGSMDQGHKPDEYVTDEQLSLCEHMLAGLLDRLEYGL